MSCLVWLGRCANINGNYLWQFTGQNTQYVKKGQVILLFFENTLYALDCPHNMTTLTLLWTLRHAHVHGDPKI